jgi:gamma-glutamyl hydrolase
MGKLLFLFSLLALSLSFTPNNRPVIGILALPNDEISEMYFNNETISYIASSYVQWVEMGGARVVPIPFNEPIEEV